MMCSADLPVGLTWTYNTFSLIAAPGLLFEHAELHLFDCSSGPASESPKGVIGSVHHVDPSQPGNGLV